MANSSGYPLSNIGMFALALALGKDPERELPHIKEEILLKKLEGAYTGYKGTVSFNIRRQGSFLLLEMPTKLTRYSVILVPERIEDNTIVCFTLSNSRKIDVEFYIKEDGGVEMIYDRYKLIKGGNIELYLNAS